MKRSLFRLHRREEALEHDELDFPLYQQGISLFFWVWNLSSHTFNLSSRGFKKILSARIESASFRILTARNIEIETSFLG